jgi:hypothetical protein
MRYTEQDSCFFFRENIHNCHYALQDVGKDDLIGVGRLGLAKARLTGTDRQQVPILSRSGKQHGYCSVILTFKNHVPLKVSIIYETSKVVLSPSYSGFLTRVVAFRMRFNLLQSHVTPPTAFAATNFICGITQPICQPFYVWRLCTDGIL